MASLLTPVKGKLFIHSSRKSTHALDGAYASLLRGHSLDFDDLRAYEYGDQIRDIDWKATARHGSPVVRRSLATRMHTVLFAVDTGLSMTALAHDDTPKKDLAILAVGVLGLLALRHGDDFCLVSGDSTAVRRREIGRSEAALEHALRTIDRAVDAAEAPSDRDALLSYIARTIARRMIVVVLTDDTPLGEETERLLRRLRVQHDVLWITLRDAEPILDSTGSGTGALRHRRDVGSHWGVPEFLHGDAELAAELHAADAVEEAHRESLLRSLAITHVALSAQDEAVGALLTMLDARSHVRHG
ncbi:DUF58 domain-containing protein [Microbacterium sp. ASV81]|uniref:DUF58 domain-containing protein n=1 Tax=Microbacterium capsulatum TaxID=3041921 RepID=A0ABU0XKX4_9MICO|nr:DUF58 domain-containing protein [Microbacterium sp. ASV81]MDQ4215791.1 DUF58 domain-containing protein [Microbacterium sp. ASV81]